MYKIAVVGDYDSIFGFAALGLDTFPVSSRKEAEEKLEALAGNQYGIIYITEDVAAECEKVIEKFKEQLLPAVILIPGVSGNTGNGVLGVKKSVEQAVGSDILFGSVCFRKKRQTTVTKADRKNWTKSIESISAERNSCFLQS